MKPQIMGILNVTPDSFSDGGQYDQRQRAVDHALEMHDQGADWVDVGGESTRPGAKAVDVQQELDRVIPVIEKLHQIRPELKISVDTSKPEVMQEATRVGASMINDVNALRSEGAVEVARASGVEVCLMHMQGDPRTMQENPDYIDVVQDIKKFLLERVKVCCDNGIAADKLILDPGFGFGKTLQHNLTLLNHLEQFKQTGHRILAGLSRKSMLGLITDQPVEKRLAGSLAAAVIACMKHADIIRVHDVRETRDALLVTTAVIENMNGEQHAT